MLKSKIHRATVTGANLDYEGSIEIDAALLERADILPFEQVQIYNISNGERFTTYVLEGKADSGVISLNGAAARRASKGDLIIIASYIFLDSEQLRGYKPSILLLDGDNRVISEDRG